MRGKVVIEHAERDWKTFYDPKLVGRYLLWHDKTYYADMPDLIELEPGQQFIPPPQPSLEDFLKWSYTINDGPTSPSPSENSPPLPD